jgi:hypothetical protein
LNKRMRNRGGLRDWDLEARERLVLLRLNLC